MSVFSTLRSLWSRIFGGPRPTPPSPKSMLDQQPEQIQTYGWVRTGSSAINRVRYVPLPHYPNHGNLIIVFANYPKQYTYYDVPISVYQDMLVKSWAEMRYVVARYSDKSRIP